MKSKIILCLMVLLLSSISYSQRDFRIHKRGMLHETIYNTGEIGRVYDCNQTSAEKGKPSMEWPGNSEFTMDEIFYAGFYNSFGGGLWISADTGRFGNSKLYQYNYVLSSTESQLGPVQCGALANTKGTGLPCVNIYSFPVSINRFENYPLNADGSVNLSYNPYDAEEKIIAQWNTPLGITVTQTSRAWSDPNYDDFIIYEYELENTGVGLPAGATLDTLREMVIAWGFGFCPSMVGWMNKTKQWNEGDMRKTDMYARIDLKRYLTYNHTRNGMPNSKYMNAWGPTGINGGGLLSPAASGVMMLYYDYAHLTPSWKTNFYVDQAREDSLYVWDSNRKMKQPYLNRYENGGLYPSKIGPVLDGKTARKTSPFNPRYSPSSDSAAGPYWYGRTKPSITLQNTQPVSHEYGFGPYFLPPHEKLRFAIAEVCGYGPGNASDVQYTDMGGGGGTATGETGTYMHPVPSWHDTLWYPAMNVDVAVGMGNTYLQNYPLPPYVNSNVVSIRDVADRAIQMYRGVSSPVKYDSLQYEPLNSPFPGVYNVPNIACPAPAITVAPNPGISTTEITWGPQVDSITSSMPQFSNLRAPLSYYQILRSVSAIGPWTVLDSVGKKDSRYYNATVQKYVYDDQTSRLATNYYYTVVSVDALGGKSGLTNMTSFAPNLPAAGKLGKVYAVPNPYFVNTPFGDWQKYPNKISICGLTKRATIYVYSYSGQLISTVYHDGDKLMTDTEWIQLTRNGQMIASGVYYFVVEDKDTGDRSWGKFVIIH